jgi:hypothetical protein
MATPTIYRSSDASAPVLTGEAGKLVALLDACLVAGYGAKSAAGWTKPYTATSYAVFRQGGGLQEYLEVLDTDPQMARVTGYEVMTAVITGTGPFPTAAQFSGGLYCRKSVTANTTARPWILFATNETFYLFIFGNSTTFGTYSGGDSNLAFGQLFSSLAGDASHTFIIAASDTSTTSTAATINRNSIPNYGPAPLAAHYLARAYTQSGGSFQFGKRSNGLYQQTQSGVAAAAYPEPVSGGLHISEIWALETALTTRGRFPGLFNLGHVYTSFTQFDTFSGGATLSGRDFMFVLTGIYGIAIETNGGW